MFFYAFGEPVYVILLIASAFVNYIGARILNDSKRKKVVLGVIVSIDLGILCIFKYTAFFIATVSQIGHLQLAVPQFVMPIGISFFTFQALSYVIDVYRGTIEVQKNYFRVLLYISFFPQLIAGPIIKYRDIQNQLYSRVVTAGEASRGMQRFIVGLSKKIFIANTMGAVADHIFQVEAFKINALAGWLGAIAYLLQIYYDFSGYSDMAIGLGRMFGFRFKENFMFPYGSTSIQEFWRKWHISLSGWFKEYLYFPLGGNRKGQVRTYVNKLIVFFLTGLWHGASWTFVVWGLFHGLFLLLEGVFPVLKRLPRAISHVYVLLVASVGFVMFRAETFEQGVYIIRQMFFGFTENRAALSLVVSQLTPWFLTMLVVGILFMAPFQRWVLGLRKKLDLALCEDNIESGRGTKQICSICMVLSTVLLACCIMRLSSGTYNPFIYFRF